MTHSDQGQQGAGWPMEEDALGRQIDAELARYAAVEPRPGLEDRILANLRAEYAQGSDRAWWRWSLAGAIAAMLVVALALAWRSGKPSHPVVANRAPHAVQSPKEPAAQDVSNAIENKARTARASLARKSAVPQPRLAAEASRPKLDQFPSAQPPSEQELAIRRYVSQFPQEATLIAKAQEEYEKEIQLQMKDARSQIENNTSDPQER